MRKDYNLEKRKYVIGGFIIVIAIIYIIRLLNLQLVDENYRQAAESNAYLCKTIYPSRGLIYDRNGNLVVFNQPAYDVVMIPRDVQPFDTLDFCKTLNITIDDFHKRMADMRKNPSYSSYTQQTFLSHLSAEDYGRLQEKLYLYPGFFIQKRILRQYNYTCGANVLGNIREVNQTDIEKNDYYKPGDYTGDLGIEKSYEELLRGTKGVEKLIRDAYGKIKGHYLDGAEDIAPLSGKDLTLSIDIELQEYGEKLMRNKIGAIVAIEPSTGEILALVTSPSYDPSLLIGRERGKNYRELVNNKYKPLFDRALQGCYPPGSTFKPTQALTFLQEGIVTTSTAYPCHRGFICGGLRVGCHGHGSPITLKPSLQTSCNGYYCWGLKYMLDNSKKYGNIKNSLNVWKDYLVSMGYGYKLGVDLPSEARGFIPNSKFYNKGFARRFKKSDGPLSDKYKDKLIDEDDKYYYVETPWSALSVISIAIGQGEVLATPLQIANLSATIANRGYFITPHVVKGIKGTKLDTLYTKKRYTKVSRNYYEDVVEGMRMAVTGGTCRSAAFGGIAICGKTGTAQNPHGKDHSAFMGFAPMDNPKIAICVYVENAGFGATYGVPIGSLMMEKYLTGEISPQRKGLEERMCNANTIISSGVKKH